MSRALALFHKAVYFRQKYQPNPNKDSSVAALLSCLLKNNKYNKPLFPHYGAV